MVPAPPPALTCKLPGPWHDSQPMSVTSFDSCRPLPHCLFRCSYLRFPFFLSAVAREWRFGNRARSVRDRSRIPLSRRTPRPGCWAERELFDWSVLQESKITASATAPPAPQNKLSRLPWIHRVSLEPHTNGEYAQKQKIVTTHFFRFFLAAYRNSTDADEPHALQHGIALAISHRVS